MKHSKKKKKRTVKLILHFEAINHGGKKKKQETIWWTMDQFLANKSLLVLEMLDLVEIVHRQDE